MRRPVLRCGTAITAFMLATAVTTHGLAGSAAGAAAPAQPWVGAASAGNSQSGWDQTNSDLGKGKLSYRRSFDKSIPAAGKEAWRDADAPHHFYSVKPPNGDIAGFIDGKYDKQLGAVAKDLPAGTRFTVFHEPEDNMSGPDFAKVAKKTVSVVKGANAGAEVWYVAMAYQWRTNSKGNVTTNKGWIDAAKVVDGVGVDVYASKSHFVAMEDDKGFQRWWAEIVKPSGKKWGVIERGVVADSGTKARVDTLTKDWALAKSRKADMFLYWNAAEYELTDPAEHQAYQKIAAEGRQK